MKKKRNPVLTNIFVSNFIDNLCKTQLCPHLSIFILKAEGSFEAG